MFPVVRSFHVYLFSVRRVLKGRGHDLQQLGSVLLVGLFLILKYLGKEWINWLLSFYFAVVGLYSVPHVRPPLSRTVSLRVFTVPFQSLISLAKFALGRQCWNRFSRTSLKIESATRSESRSFPVPERSSLFNQRSCLSRVGHPLSTSHLPG